MWTEQFKNCGFAVIHDVVPNGGLDQVLDQITDPSIRRTRAGVRHAMSISVIRELANDSRLMNIARKILGPGAVPIGSTLFDKSPSSNWLVVWHQDTALPMLERREVAGWGSWSVKDGITYSHAPARALERILALRIHLDESGKNNGPLRVLPGTHTTGVLSDDQIETLAGALTPMDCLVSRGGVLAMRPLIVHASSKSSADSPRRVLHIEYAESVAIGDGLELAIA